MSKLSVESGSTLKRYVCIFNINSHMHLRYLIISYNHHWKEKWWWKRCTLLILKDSIILFKFSHIIQEDFLITNVTSSFKIRISVTLTFVHVSPTRWTLNGSTILSEEDSGSQDFDCKNIVWRFLYYESSMLPLNF